MFSSSVIMSNFIVGVNPTVEIYEHRRYEYLNIVLRCSTVCTEAVEDKTRPKKFFHE